jgi:hypothetical protein
MGFVQHTKCVRIQDKVYPSWSPAPTTMLILVSIPVLLAALANPYLAIIEVPLLIAYCLWWLYDRLICLGGEVCAIGLLGKPEPPSMKSGFDKFDTDFSINLVLAPHNIQELPPGYPGTVPPPPGGADPTEYYHEKFLDALHGQIADDGIQGNLIKEQPTTKDEGWDFRGYFNTVGSRTEAIVHHHQPYLHCEWEGGGMHKLLMALYVVLALVTAAAIACAIPIIGTIVCAILMVAALAVSVAGVVAALNDTGTPAVTDPVTGQTTDQLHPGEDILFVRGDWVYDSAHEGWNEVHPLKVCYRVGTAKYEAGSNVDWDAAIGSFMVARGRWKFDPADPTRRTFFKDAAPKAEDWRAWVQSWCDGGEQASSGITIHNQGRPENKWAIHPVIDGCRPEPEGPPPIH